MRRTRYDYHVKRICPWAAILAIVIMQKPVSAEFMAGASAVNITPVLCDDAAPHAGRKQFDSARGCYKWIHLAGFSPYVPLRHDVRLATGVHDPLWARTLALRDANGETLVLVAVDLPGLSRKHTGPIRRRVANTHGIPVTKIIIHSTHTHSAPDASGYWSTLMAGHNRQYGRQLRDQIYQSITTALDALQPATLKTVTTTHVSCIDRYSGNLKRDPQCKLPDINNEFDDRPSEYDRYLIQRDQRDPIVRNTRIVAAQLTASDTGDTIATLVNWHNHPDTLGSSNRFISSDYPHYVRTRLEQVLGGTAIYIVGTLGNQIGGLRSTPVPLWTEDGERVLDTTVNGQSQQVLVTEGWDKIRSTGYEVAQAALDALDGASPRAAPRLGVQSTYVDTPVDNAIHVLGTWSVWHDRVEPPERLRYSWPSCLGVLGCVRAEVSLIEIGDLSMLTAPGEIDPAYVYGRHASTAEYGDIWSTWHFPAIEGVDQLMPGTHHGFIGSAHDYLSYMVPKTDNVGWWNFDHPNHYEEWVTIGKRFGDDIATAWRTLLELPRTTHSP